MTDVTINVDGPMFNGLAKAAVDSCVDTIAQEVSAQASANVSENLNESIKDPTPYYETQIALDRIAPLTYLVHDRGVIYGPWLEGTGSRNRTTRFKGYASFRRATQQTKQDAQRIADTVVRRFLPRMGGD